MTILAGKKSPSVFHTFSTYSPTYSKNFATREATTKKCSVNISREHIKYTDQVAILINIHSGA
jgi:hypothetical protein